jgi:hypothetical protein
LSTRRILIFISLIAASLALGAGATPATAAARPAYPAALSSFNPNGIVPGEWHLVRRTGVLYLTSGLLSGCHSAGASWQRQDGTQVRLIWAACGSQEINLLSSTYAVARTRIPASWRDLSVLGANVDLVQARQGQVWRFWLQGDLSLALLSVCPHQTVRACADISAPAAHYLAARLPGRLVVTKTTSVLPPVSGLLSGIVLLFLMIVGGGRISKRAKLEKFTMLPGSQKVQSVDRAADRLRKLSRRRWWAKLFIIVGLALLVSAIGGAARRASAQAVGDAAVGILIGAAGLVMLHRYRHPLFSKERYNVRRALPQAFRVRRFFSVVLTLLLGVLSMAVPLAVLAGWVLAGLASDEQDSSSILAGLVLVAIVAGYFIDRAAQRLRARNLQEAMKSRPDYLLYLRNFGDDDQTILTSRFNRRGVWQRSTGWLNPIGTARFEEVLTRAMAHSGPIVAVGQPGDKLHKLFSAIAPTLGAAKTTLPHTGWKAQVEDWAVAARAVVVSATPAHMGDGFAAELEMLAKDVEHGRIVLVFGTGKKEDLYRRCGTFLSTVGAYPLFQDLLSGWLTDGTLVLVHSPADGWGTWRGWGAERRTAWTYTAAIGAAMAYATETWARPPAKPIPPPEQPAGASRSW